MYCSAKVNVRDGVNEKSKVGAAIMDLGKWYWKVVGLRTHWSHVKSRTGVSGKKAMGAPHCVKHRSKIVKKCKRIVFCDLYLLIIFFIILIDDIVIIDFIFVVIYKYSVAIIACFVCFIDLLRTIWFCLCHNGIDSMYEMVCSALYSLLVVILIRSSSWIYWIYYHIS